MLKKAALLQQNYIAKELNPREFNKLANQGLRNVQMFLTLWLYAETTVTSTCHEPTSVDGKPWLDSWMPAWSWVFDSTGPSPHAPTSRIIWRYTTNVRSKQNMRITTPELWILRMLFEHIRGNYGSHSSHVCSRFAIWQLVTFLHGGFFVWFVY